MVRVIGLSLPHWDLGFIGYVGGSEDDVERAYINVVNRCYPLSFDLLREPSGKVSCILSVISRGLPINTVVFQLDPYGIANSVGSQYGINRSLIISEVYRWFLDYLINHDYLSPGDNVEVDEELHVLSNYMRNAKLGGHAASMASIVASAMSLKTARNYPLPIKILDLRSMVMDYVSRRISSSGGAHQSH